MLKIQQIITKRDINESQNLRGWISQVLAGEQPCWPVMDVMFRTNVFTVAKLAPSERINTGKSSFWFRAAVSPYCQ